MPRIKLQVEIQAPVETVFGVARDVERFPEYMEDLESIRVIERSEDGLKTVTEWIGLIREFKMKVKWTQEDLWNPATFRDDFVQLEGDMDSMSGYWEFVPQGGQTRFDCLVDYEYNVPLVGPLIKALIRKKMEANLRAQMEAIKAEAESRVPAAKR